MDRQKKLLLDIISEIPGKSAHLSILYIYTTHKWDQDLKLKSIRIPEEITQKQWFLTLKMSF